MREGECFEAWDCWEAAVMRYFAWHFMRNGESMRQAKWWCHRKQSSSAKEPNMPHGQSLKPLTLTLLLWLHVLQLSSTTC